MRVSASKVGLVFGSLLGISHLLWVLLVATGLAQPFMNFIFRLHFIDPPYHVMPFRIELALGLVALTFAIGFVGGWVAATVWNFFPGAARQAPR